MLYLSSERDDCRELEETKDSILAEKQGTSLRLGLDLAESMVGVTQRVSRPHNRHVRSSSRRPSSIDSAHLENTDRDIKMSCSRKAIPIKTF